MTLLETDSPQQIFLVTFLMIAPSSPHNLIIIAISNSNLSDCSFQILLPVINFSHTVISLEFSLCKGTWTLWASYIPVFFMQNQYQVSHCKVFFPAFKYFLCFSPPTTLCHFFYPPKNVAFKTALYTEVSFHCWGTSHIYQEKSIPLLPQHQSEWHGDTQGKDSYI